MATELTDVIASVKAPASIALWGPWGSGKSGLAYLLETDLGKRLPKARFVRFDAFKFAETPLRRHFISQVAEALGIGDEKFREGLYRTSVRTDFKVPRKSLASLLGIFLLALLVVEVAAALLIVILAALSPGSFQHAFDNSIKSGLGLALAPAGILAAFIALAGQTLPVSRTTSAPSSDEEFERLFVDLVGKAKAKPLVVFIDELDRCSAEEVVSTLEAIRTFLDVNGVVFVVAADQQVLERALRQAARQTTPPDAINPYYSAGSAYLDKIFQYQFSLPPLRTSGLINYALDLTEGLGGVWETVDRPQVISVLIPTHVRSPRRVKRLLNGFVLTYRLARRRAGAERLDDDDVVPRAAEIAKLACLQIEFPLFATDLSIEPRMLEWVLKAKVGEALPGYLPPEVRRRAQAYAEGRLDVDEIIATDETDCPAAEKGPSELRPETPGADPIPGEGQESPGSRGLKEGDAEKRGSECAKVGRIHAEQLIRYLQKTRHIRGPEGDLVFMESRGALFGLDAAVANALAGAAMDGELDEVRRTIGELDDPDLQRAALRLLARRGTEASIGIGGQNTTSSLLVAISALPDLDITPIADELADSVASQEESQAGLRPEELGGALALATVSSRQISDRLLGLVLERPEAETTVLGAQVVAEADHMPRSSDGRIAQIAAARMAVEPAPIVAALCDLEDSVLDGLLGYLTEGLPEVLAQADAEPAPEGEESVSATGEAVSALADGIARLAGEERAAAAEKMALVLLGIDTQEARHAFVDDTTSLTEIGGAELGEAVLRIARRNRAASDWPRWLDRLPSETVKKVPTAPEQIDGLGADLWNLATREEDPIEGESLQATLGSLGRLADAAETTGAATAAAVAGTTAVAPLDLASAELQGRSLQLADRFAEAGLVRVGQFAPATLDSIGDALTQPFEPRSPDDVFASRLVEWAVWLAPSAGDESRDRLRESVEASSWLPAPYPATLTLAAALRDQADPAPSPYSTAEMVELLEAHGTWFAEGLVLWIERFGPGAPEVGIAIVALGNGEFPKKVGAALDARFREADGDDLAQLVMPTLERLNEEDPGAGRLRSLGIERADPATILTRLIALFDKAGSNEERERVMEVVAMLGPLEDSLRRRLILEVIIPLTGRGKEAVDIAVRHLNLCLPPPHGTKGKLRDALRSAAKGRQQIDRVDKALLDAGLVRKTGIFGRGRKDIPES
ncbi:MAG: hypothetical protein JSS97_05940 [Actinobacteria bacterium]|nr:hypothetical protein [Actinomycetota bacterium]